MKLFYLVLFTFLLSALVVAEPSRLGFTCALIMGLVTGVLIGGSLERSAEDQRKRNEDFARELAEFGEAMREAEELPPDVDLNNPLLTKLVERWKESQE